MSTTVSQARYWIGTISLADWTPHLPDGITWLRGQPERGDGGYEHWQIVFSFTQKKTLSQAKRLLGVATAHLEPTRSSAAKEYVWKLDTRAGEPFEFGTEVLERNKRTDWTRVRLLASAGRFDEIPADIYIRYYGNLRRIYADNIRPTAMERTVTVYWGATGTGKSRKAFELAGETAYSKDPRTKFWCGYSGEESAVIDEFRGAIDISHLLRWFDRYPVTVELKGSSAPLMVKTFYVTSNLDPRNWFPELDSSTLSALMRRLKVEHFS